ncbi:MAG TPA: MBL fold metallo-hydrolase [Thermoanaerobaculia bacterium]
MMKRYGAAALALMVCLPIMAQTNWDAVKIDVTKVSGNVYMLTGQGGNIGVSVGEDGIVIVDDQYAPLAPKIREALRGITDKPLRFVLNTHFHGDHTGGNEPFGREATIIAHENVRKRMESGLNFPGRQVPAAPKGALPVITFNSSATVHLNGEDIRAVHFPAGHTDGDAIIWFTKSGVVHMGDDFFNGRFPFIDVQAGGSVRGFVRNVDMVLATLPDSVKIIPGHGPLADKAALQRFSEMLNGSVAAVESAVRAGRTLDQMKADKILSRWESWNWQFINTDSFLTTIYNEVSK